MLDWLRVRRSPPNPPPTTQHQEERKRVAAAATDVPLDSGADGGSDCQSRSAGDEALADVLIGDPETAATKGASLGGRGRAFAVSPHCCVCAQPFAAGCFSPTK